MARKSTMLLVLLLLMSCRPTYRQPIRVGLDMWTAYSLAFLAEERGFFKDEGLDIEIVEFSSPHDSRVAMEDGNIDILLTTMVDAVVLASKGTGVTVPYVIDYSYGGDGIVCRKGISSLGELKGKKVGLEPASLGLFTLARALEKTGVKTDELQIVDISPPEAEEMFAKGTLDAAVTWEPFLSRMSRRGGGVLFTSKEIPWEIVDIFCFRTDVVGKNPGVVPGVLKAWLRAVSFWKSQPDEASLIMAEGMNIKPEELYVGMEGAHVLDLRLNIAAFGMENMPGPVYETADKVSQTLHSIGMIDKPFHGRAILDRKPLMDLLAKGGLWTENLTK